MSDTVSNYPSDPSRQSLSSKSTPCTHNCCVFVIDEFEFDRKEHGELQKYECNGLG